MVRTGKDRREGNYSEIRSSGYGLVSVKTVQRKPVPADVQELQKHTTTFEPRLPAKGMAARIRREVPSSKYGLYAVGKRDKAKAPTPSFRPQINAAKTVTQKVQSSGYGLRSYQAPKRAVTKEKRPEGTYRPKLNTSKTAMLLRKRAPSSKYGKVSVPVPLVEAPDETFTTQGTRVDAEFLAVTPGDQVYRFSGDICDLTHTGGRVRLQRVPESGQHVYVGKWKQHGWEFDMEFDQDQWRASRGEVAVTYTLVKGPAAFEGDDGRALQTEDYIGQQGREFLKKPIISVPAPKKAAVSLYTVLLDKVESDDNDESVLVDEEKLARDALEKQRLAEREANYNVDAVRASNNEEGWILDNQQALTRLPGSPVKAKIDAGVESSGYMSAAYAPPTVDVKEPPIDALREMELEYDAARVQKAPGLGAALAPFAQDTLAKFPQVPSTKYGVEGVPVKRPSRKPQDTDPVWLAPLAPKGFAAAAELAPVEPNPLNDVVTSTSYGKVIPAMPAPSLPRPPAPVWVPTCCDFQKNSEGVL